MNESRAEMCENLAPMSSTVRVRFAPSPTGFLHVGGARTALFNWLFARNKGGTFVLRVEDTDKSRNTEEAAAAIFEGLRWLGLDWDEGPQAGGELGPYFQSERESIYAAYLAKLTEANLVYEDAGATRFRSPRKPLEVDDIVCGKIIFDRAMEPDMTIRRPDGSWIFHFVNVVDDIEMKISHVIRGEDHLSNTPKHIELYQAFGATPPRFAHIPLILNRDGTKMSKRDQGASIASYREQGYAPEAVRNYLCLLGWSPKDNREKIDIEEVIQIFDLEKVNRRNAAFDLDKCYWLNGQYLAQMSLTRFKELGMPFLVNAGIAFGSDEALLPVLAIVKEKIKHLNDLPNWISYFFTEDYEFDAEAADKSFKKPGAMEKLGILAQRYEGLTEWTPEVLEATLKALALELGCKTAELIHPARVAASGRSVGPSLYHMLEVLGQKRVVARLRRAVEKFA